MEDKNFRHIVRIANTDIKGSLRVYHALTMIYGVKYAFANAIITSLSLDRQKKVGELDSADIKKIEDAIANPQKNGIPPYLLNRQKDFESGQDKHLIGAALKFTKEMDVKLAKKIKSYKGMRHSFGLPVRGQRTRSNFRHGASLGVQRSKAKMAAASGEKTKGDKK